MKSLLSIAISSDRIFEIFCLVIGIYLLFHPALRCPQSYAVALGGGLLLLLFKCVTPEAFVLLGKAWWLFLLYIGLSFVWSPLPGLTFQSAAFVFLGTLLYLMARARDSMAKIGMETTWVLTAGVAATIALAQRFYGFDQIALALPNLSGEELKIATAGAHNHRAFGPLVTPGALAALMVLFIPLGFILAWIHSGFKKILFSFLAFLLVLGLWSAQSVGALVCLTLAVLVALGIRKSRIWIAVTLGLGLTGVWKMVAMRGLQSWLWAAFSMRLELWESAWTLFLQHPLLGSGLGTFGEAYQRSGFSLDTGARFAHNLLLQLLVETGLTGTVLFLWAIAGFIRRLKIPSRWEGWGVLTGIIAFILFSLVDLPFQMPELVWVFALMAGRLELRHEKKWFFPVPSLSWLEYGLLAVLLVSGFWPPFRPWNFALLAGALWVALALLGKSFDRTPLWVLLGGLFIGLRAFNSPSSDGTVRFLETAGIALAFWLVAGDLDSKGSFIRRFCLLGLVWGAAAWFVSFSGAPFEAWANFTNPKHLAVFLIPLFLLFFPAKISQTKNILVSGAAILTMARLRATGALLGLTVGFLMLPKISKKIKILSVMIMVLAAVAIHGFQPSSTQWDRILIWKASAQVWGLHWLMGNGPGVFDGEFQKIKEPRSGGFSRYLMEAGYSHNEFFEFLTAFGLIGGFFLAVGLWVLFRKGKYGSRTAALVGVGTASLLDFCLHTPRVFLQWVGLMSPANQENPKVSWPAGFLVFGLVCGLFGAAAFAPRLEVQASEAESQNQFPQELRLLETAEQLNAWDVRVAWTKVQFLEKLYLATGDPNWKRKFDDTLAKILGLEPTQGDWYWKKAGLLSEQANKEKSPASMTAAVQAWREAESQLPYSAYLRYEEGMFFLQTGQKKEAVSSLQKAVELEPNYALAWAKLGFLLKMSGNWNQARQAFQRALQIHETWKDKPIDPPEKPMLAIPDDVINQIRQEARL